MTPLEKFELRKKIDKLKKDLEIIYHQLEQKPSMELINAYNNKKFKIDFHEEEINKKKPIKRSLCL